MERSEIKGFIAKRCAKELKNGDVVKVKITEIDFEKKRVSLSIRALLEDEQANASEESPVEE